MFWRDITLSVWRKKTTGLKTKKRLLPLVLAAALCSSPVWAEEATFTANFKDTDLKSFIETVGANLNKTIIMGPGVQGKVSIRTMTPLNERQYYQLFLNLLEAQGYAVVPMENDVLKVVKSSAAKVEPLPLVGEGSDNYAGDEMVTKVVPVRNVSVRELAPILRQMIDSAGSGNVVNYDPSNVIMLTGRASVVERLTEVIQRVDHAGNRTEEVIPLDNASASEIARVLESLTKNSGENQPATLKSQISDIEMRGFTFDQKRQILHLQLRAANFASFDKLRSALATDYVVQQDALQKEGDAVSGGVTLRRK
ncbi:TPA: secretin N-terminal domain-containing protein [Escherichia coli]